MNSVHKSKDCMWSHRHCSAYIGTDVKTKTLGQWQSFKHARRATCLTGQDTTMHAPRFYRRHTNIKLGTGLSGWTADHDACPLILNHTRQWTVWIENIQLCRPAGQLTLQNIHEDQMPHLPVSWAQLTVRLEKRLWFKLPQFWSLQTTSRSKKALYRRWTTDNDACCLLMNKVRHSVTGYWHLIALLTCQDRKSSGRLCGNILVSDLSKYEVLVPHR